MKFNSVILAIDISVLILLSACASKPSAPVKPQMQWIEITRDNALKIAQTQERSLLGRLTPSADPYFGKRSPSPTCDRSKLPKPVEDLKSESFRIELQLYASGTGAMGFCNPKVETRKARISWIYCANTRTMYDVREFKAADATWFEDEGPTCEAVRTSF